MLVGLATGPATVAFAFAKSALGALGNASSALFETCTSTPWLAPAHGACAGALLTIDVNLPGAAAHPFDLSNNVSVCATNGIGLTTSGGADVEPVFKLTIAPLIYVVELDA